jgi:hypothetical protein
MFGLAASAMPWQEIVRRSVRRNFMISVLSYVGETDV